MKMKLLSLVILWTWALPIPAAAFSFLPAGFAPGEQILSIQLAADTGGMPSTPTVTFDTVTNQLVFQASISQINTTVTSYAIPIGDLIFDSQLTLSSELLLAPNPPLTNGNLFAEFVNGMVADFTITDVADAGNLLLAADYNPAQLDFQAAAPATAVTGSFSSEFDVLGMSDANFAGAFGSAGNYFANLSNFVSNGVPVTTDLCDLVVNGDFLCITGVGQLDSFTVNPTATIIPLSVPEPGSTSLIALGLLGVLARRRRA